MRTLRYSALGVATALLFAAYWFGARLEEQLGLPWLFEVRGAIEPPRDVVVVGLDDRSAAQLGLSSVPREWPRSLHGKLVDELVRRGASVIAFDLRFERPQSAVEDRAFAEAVARAGRVVLFERLLRIESSASSVSIEQQPLPILAEAALATAPFPLPQLPARVSQFWSFWQELGDAPTLPAIALQARAGLRSEAWSELLQRAGLTAVDGTTSNAGSAAMNLNELAHNLRLALVRDPLLASRLEHALADREQQAAASARVARQQQLMRTLVNLYLGPRSRYLNFYGPPGTIRTVPYSALTAEGADQAQTSDLDLTDATVFVGYSELAFPTKIDGFDTVFTRADGVQLSGVEIAATAFANLATGRSLRPTGPIATGLILLAFAATSAACTFLLSPLRAVAATIVITGAYVTAAQLAFDRAALWMPLAVPLLIELPLALLGGLVYQRRQFWETLKVFVPEEVARETAGHPGDPLSVRRTRFATCLVSDAEDYTALVERMKPADAAAFLNEYFDAVSPPLRRHAAAFVEFHADNVLSAWISDSPQPELCRQACLSALEVLAATDAFNARKAPLHLGIRIGLHAGEGFIGNVGADGRVAFRMVGDIVNTASRVEGLNKALRTRLLATEAVVAAVSGLLLRPLGRFRLKGKQAEIAIVEIVSTEAQASIAQITLCNRFAQALQAYQAQRWGEAVEHLRDLVEDYPGDGPSDFYLRLCMSQLNATRGTDDAIIIAADATSVAVFGTRAA